MCTFATESTGFSEYYPDIVPHLLTLASNFRMPFYRDILLALGICSVSKQSCSNILKAGPGQAITIVVGGAAESLSARPGTADLTLRKRLGFIKIAIQHGCVGIYAPLCTRTHILVGLTSFPYSRLARMTSVQCVPVVIELLTLLSDLRADAQ